MEFLLVLSAIAILPGAIVAACLERTRHEPARLPTATFTDLRFPGVRASASTMIGGLALIWLLALTGSGGRFLDAFEAMQLLLFLGTMFMSAAAVSCAVAFAFRRAAWLAAIYSASALCVAFGFVGLITLAIPARRGFERRELESLIASPAARDAVQAMILALIVAALAPALVAQAIYLTRRRAELTDDLRDWLRRWGGY